uniref:Erythromycin biosynthesis protein CIII-like C-terminal domain-containing protein n=1 Tax=Dunaliella tertiolecta TaxID=3047 RepID=A0A6S8JD36_DUNTE
MQVQEEHQQHMATFHAVQSLVLGEQPQRIQAIIFNLFALESFSIAEALGGVPCVAAAPYQIPYRCPSGFARGLAHQWPGIYRLLENANKRSKQDYDGTQAKKMCGMVSVTMAEVLHWMWPLFSPTRWCQLRQAIGLAPWVMHDPCTHRPVSSLPAPTPLLYGFSELYLPRPGFWPLSVHVSGFWTPRQEWFPPGLPEPVAAALHEVQRRQHEIRQNECTQNEHRQNEHRQNESQHRRGELDTVCLVTSSSSSCGRAGVYAGNEGEDGGRDHACEQPVGCSSITTVALERGMGPVPHAPAPAGTAAVLPVPTALSAVLSRELAFIAPASAATLAAPTDSALKAQASAPALAMAGAAMPSELTAASRASAALPDPDERMLTSPPEQKALLVDFGSMGSMGLIPDPMHTCEILARALLHIKRCALLLTAWQPLQEAHAGLTPLLQRTLVLLPGPVPHTILLPSCDAVLHPGGSGTTAAGLIAGTPQCICPLHFDQFFHAERVGPEGLDLAPHPLPRHTLFGQRNNAPVEAAALVVAEALKSTLQPGRARACKRFAQESFKKEDGLHEAAKWIRASGRP